MKQPDWLSLGINFIISCIAWVTRMTFGKDHLTKLEAFCFFLSSMVWIWLVSLMKLHPAWAGGLGYLGGLAIPSIIKIVVRGSKNAEVPASKIVEEKIVENVQHISDNVEDIKDAVKNKNKK